MRMAKADEKDFETTLTFMKACENMWDKRPFEFHEPAEEWETWDDDDKDKQELLYIKNRFVKELGEDVDYRIVVYEWIRRKYKECNCNWARVYWAAHILVPEVCDPQLTYLSYSPFLEKLHVAPEQ